MFADLLKGLPKQLDDLKARAANEADAAAKQRLQQQVGVQTAFAASLKELKVTPPNVTLVDRMTLFRGDREIRLLYLGHGHTGGDVVVYLPKEKVLCTGDLLVHDVANLIDGYVNEWPDALEKLKPIDFVDVIPGHGEPFKGKERDRLVPGVPPGFVEARQRAARAEGAGCRCGEAHRHDRSQGALPGHHRTGRESPGACRECTR